MITLRKKSRGRTNDDQPNPIDIHIGKRLNLRRKMLGMSQEDVAIRLGITFQQIQKYEKGQNRISGSRLWIMSRTLQVPVDFFFADMDEGTFSEGERLFSATPVLNNNIKHTADEVFLRTDVIELVNAYIYSDFPEVTALLKAAMVKLPFKVKNNA